MYSFRDDYSEGAHINILQALMESNLKQEIGYSNDSHCEKAISLIKKELDDESCNIHFIPGGTQTNLVAISSFLRPHEACIAVETGHIATHETGAIEATGHKVITVATDDGKINLENIKIAFEEHTDEHMVKPRLVYISNPTELGTTYSANELKAIYELCKELDMYLYVDGARLGAALVAEEGNLDLKDFSKYTDAFFIGGTKNGALLGEALVINNKNLQGDTRYIIKQKGAMAAKGRILGIQFEELFKDGLYLKLAKHACDMAQKIQNTLIDMGYNMFVETKTNQIFPIMTNDLIDKLKKDYDFHDWCKIDDNNKAIRLVCSWATDEKEVDEFIDKIRKYK